MEPTCTMVNPATGERMSFGMNGITSGVFEKLDVAPELFYQLMETVREKHPMNVE